MARKYSKIRKTLISTLCVVTLSCTGLAAACSGNKDKTDEKNEPFVKRDDLQTLKNGNFEYYNYPDAKTLTDGKAEYLIKTPDNWTRAGDSTGTLGGIIGTSHSEWAALTSDDLSDRLTANADLKTSSDKYVNYNGMRARDVLYKDTYAALLESSKVSDSYINYQTFADYFGITKTAKDGGYEYKMGKTTVYISDKATDSDQSSETAWKNYEFFFDADHTKSVRAELIENPGTHYNIQYNETTDKHTFENGSETVELKCDEATGSLYYTVGEGSSAEDVFVSNVLMLHNYDNDISSSGTTNSSKYNGVHQYYSSQTVTLEANTAAEISVWVKTADLKFDKGYSQLTDQDRGAYIEVTQTVSGSQIDSFKIKNINTEKIIADSKANNYETEESNGWLKYTIYVNSCDFAASTVQIRLGLGGDDASEKVTGYAFFDDVTVSKYLDLDDEDCTYYQHKDNLVSCSLVSSEEEKIFIADKDLRNNEYRESKNFYYLIDLASDTGDYVYTRLPIAAGGSGANTSAWLTEYKSGSDIYVSALSSNASLGKFANISVNSAAKLPRNTEARLTDNDLIGIYDYDYSFKTADFNTAGYDFKDYSSTLNKALTDKDSRLPGYEGELLVMLSSRGAAYTSKVIDDSFKVASKGYLIVSLWVKTSDMNGSTAATLKVTSLSDDEKSTALTVDTTGKTTDIGDDKDLYKGWVECFFFIENASDTEQSFKLDLSFGNTTINSDTSFKGGYVAFANLRSLVIDKDVYSVASAGDTLAKLSYTVDDSKKSGHEFDSVSGTADIKDGISNLANYNGINGGSSTVSDSPYRPSYDTKNTNDLAGLINRDYFDEYGDTKTRIENAFGANNYEAATAWGKVFGDNCYQPIVIINNLRVYSERAEATKDTYSLYYVKAADSYTGADAITVNGQKYKKATEWDESETYYSFAANYGFTGKSTSISADSCQTVSVRVRVAGDAQAWVYLVDENREVMHYTTSESTYHYDADGNVLDEKFDADWKKGSKEHRSHIVYTLRSDGLYEDKDGKIRFNLDNLIKKYDNYLFDLDKEKYQFFDKQTDGNKVSVSDLKDNVTYYDKDGNVAPHYLANTDGKRIFEYKDGKHYYIKDGKTTSTVVERFAPEYRRNYVAADREFAVCVTDTHGEWVTVTFAIKTGNAAKNYSLELWSGKRGESGVEIKDGQGACANGAVAFEYSSYSITSSNFTTISTEYESNLIGRYKQLLLSKNLLGEIESNDENLNYYKTLCAKLVGENKLTAAEVNAIEKDYEANYFAYSFYDSPSFAPIEQKDWDNYTYDATDESANGETLAYLEYRSLKDDRLDSLSIFADYSIVDKTISSNAPADDDNDDDNNNSNGGNENEANIWLYAASILLLVALLITLISLIVRKVWKKVAPKVNAKKMSKNNYRKRERYIRKLHLVKEETTEENAEPNGEANAENEGNAENADGAENAAEPAETPVESPVEAPAEGAAEPAEAPAAAEEPEKASDEASDAPADGENKE